MMTTRITLGRFFLRLGGFIQSLAVIPMRPEDLVEFTRQFYAKSSELEYWSTNKLVDQGLNPIETKLLGQIPLTTGRLLVLGVGGGRDAIPLAKAGFTVTGVDYIPGMVKKAQENAARHGVQLEGLVQETNKLNVPASSYDVAWLANSMYSSIPTRKSRVETLRRVRQALKPGGYFYCSFHWEKGPRFSPKVELARRIFAIFPLANLRYEPGGILWFNQEFLHVFSSETELCAEFDEGGFSVLSLEIPQTGVEGGVLLVRR